MDLVVGATGLVGGEICKLLAEQRRPVRAAVRGTPDTVKAQSLRSAGAHLVVADVKDRESLDIACTGVKTVLSTASATISRKEGDNIDTVDLKGQMNLIDAAYAAGAEHFIYVSFSKNFDIDFPLRTAKRTVEDYLKGSGLTYTILRPSVFMEVWLSPAIGFDYSNARVQIFGSGENKISWISYKDLARFALMAMESQAARNAIIEIGGPEALSPLEVVRIFEEVGGKKFDVERVPEEGLRSQKSSATDPMQETFAALMLGYAKGDAIPMEETLRTFPVPMKTVRQYAREVLGKI